MAAIGREEGGGVRRRLIACLRRALRQASFIGAGQITSSSPDSWALHDLDHVAEWDLHSTTLAHMVTGWNLCDTGLAQDLKAINTGS